MDNYYFYQFSPDNTMSQWSPEDFSQNKPVPDFLIKQTKQSTSVNQFKSNNKFLDTTLCEYCVQNKLKHKANLHVYQNQKH